MDKLTKAQQSALLSVYNRQWGDKPKTYLAFRRTAINNSLIGCVMVPYAGMWLGIEEDGYTHS
jgi:hypothetical protein